MPFLAAPAALPLISAGVGALGSIFGSKSNTSKSTSTSSTAVNTPDSVKPLQDSLIQTLLARMQDPTQGTDPVRIAGRNRINANFEGADQAVRDKFATSGGKSGKTGMGYRKTENSRAAALSGFDGDIASLILGRQDNTLSLSEQLMRSMQGSTTTGSGTQTNPGNPAGAGLGSLGSSLGTLSTLSTLSKLLSGGGPDPNYHSGVQQVT